MSGRHDQRGAPAPDRDGISIQPRGGMATRLSLLAALVIVGAGATYLLSRGHSGIAGRGDVREAANIAASAPSGEKPTPGSDTAAARTAVARGLAPPLEGEDPTADLSDVLPAGSAPSMAEVIDGLHEAGIHSGLGAFPKPGTSPPLVGMAVPEDYPLPPGYVRHYQATDDGQRIEPILMFAPDAGFVDAGGRAVPLPPDRVVPPAMAPPGMPVRLIRIPPPRPGAGG